MKISPPMVDVARGISFCNCPSQILHLIVVHHQFFYFYIISYTSYEERSGTLLSERSKIFSSVSAALLSFCAPL